MRRHRPVAQSTNHRQTFIIRRLVRLLWRHLLQRQLINDIPRIDQLRHGLQRKRKLLKLPVPLLHIRVMALQAVLAQKLLHQFRPLISGQSRANQKMKPNREEPPDKALFPSESRSGEKRSRHHANRPVLLPNESVSTPIFCAMSTNRLHKGTFLIPSRGTSRNSPCL